MRKVSCRGGEQLSSSCQVDNGECLACSLRSLDPGPSTVVPGQAQSKEGVPGLAVLEPRPTDGGWIRNQDTKVQGKDLTTFGNSLSTDLQNTFSIGSSISKPPNPW
ncbi:hypothetical protein KIL84_010028 [Mauremys mutica]|uniref:Uncharacterized protein n=1 Tax=Mauremys mutica TaxID=74926 RepID=A0A9D3XIU7_9SAUR|nr:hypothetical protein KIL84_010028 [Mauremys mutica]